MRQKLCEDIKKLKEEKKLLCEDIKKLKEEKKLLCEDIKNLNEEKKSLCEGIKKLKEEKKSLCEDKSDIPNKQHKININKMPTWKDAHKYCKNNGLTGQFTGPALEKYIKIKHNMKKNKASSCNGDLNYRRTNFEVKVSTGGITNDKFNYVQLRVNHKCDYILSAYYKNKDEFFVFRLDGTDIKEMIIKHGGYAHGTIKKLGRITREDVYDITNQKEYAVRPIYGNECWADLLRFRIDEFGI